MSDVIPFPTKEADEPGFGGLVERTSLILAIYGTDLDPEKISGFLGINATRGFRKGEKSGRAAERGAWVYSLNAVSPLGPEQLLEKLFSDLGDEGASALSVLGERYEIQFRLVLRMEGYNRGFDLSAQSASRIASVGGSLSFSIYSEN